MSRLKKYFINAAAACLLLAPIGAAEAAGEVISEQPVVVAEQPAPYVRHDQNGQDDKIGFVNQKVNEEMYSSYMLVKQVTPYEVKSGTVIPGVLITGMNSDLPGTVIGQVSENVYDSTEGKYLLIPQGTVRLPLPRSAGLWYGSALFSRMANRLFWKIYRAQTRQVIPALKIKCAAITAAYYGAHCSAALLPVVLPWQPMLTITAACAAKPAARQPAIFPVPRTAL